MKCNRAQLGDILGIGLTTVDARVKEGMPYLRRPGEDGSKEWQFDTVDVIEWLTGRIDAGAKNDEGKEAKVRIAVADARLKELELAERLGLMINIEDIMPRIEAGDAIVKSRLLAIPGRLAQTLAVETDPVVVERMLKAEVNGALAELDKDWKERG